MTVGWIESGAVPSACGANGSAGILCLENLSNCPGDWLFTIDSLDGTLEMSQVNPEFSCWIEDLAYTRTMGPCTGVPPQDAGPQVPSVH